MKITYWSDFACPYCYIGEERLLKAIKRLGMENDIELEMKSYELESECTQGMYRNNGGAICQKHEAWAKGRGISC